MLYLILPLLIALGAYYAVVYLSEILAKKYEEMKERNERAKRFAEFKRKVESGEIKLPNTTAEDFWKIGMTFQACTRDFEDAFRAMIITMVEPIEEAAKSIQNAFGKFETGGYSDGTKEKKIL